MLSIQKKFFGISINIVSLVCLLYVLSFLDEHLVFLRNLSVFLALPILCFKDFWVRLSGVKIDLLLLGSFMMLQVVFLLSTIINGNGFHMYEDYRRDFLKTLIVLPLFAYYVYASGFEAALHCLKKMAVAYAVFIAAFIAYYTIHGMNFVELRKYWHLSIMFFPFLLDDFFKKKNVNSSMFYLITFCILYVVAGFRGLMLIAAVLSVLFSLKNKNFKLIFYMLAAFVTSVVLVKYSSPQYFEYLHYKLTQTDSGLRVSGAWLPTLEMLSDRTLLGFGYGSHEFRSQFVEYYKLHKEWSNPYVPFPHNIFLEVAFYGGVCALIFFVCFWGRCLTCLNARKSAQVIFLGFVTYFLIHGFLEPVLWQLLPFVLLLGLKRNKLYVS